MPDGLPTCSSSSVKYITEEDCWVSELAEASAGIELIGMSVFFAAETELDMYLFPPPLSLDSCLQTDLCDFGMAPRRFNPYMVKT